MRILNIKAICWRIFNMKIQIELASNRKAKPEATTLGFGKYFTDHMFILDYTEGKGWHDPRIVPYQPITLDPASKVFHYGQTVFEGLKAYVTEANEVLLFRPQSNFKRLNLSNERLCIPAIDEELALEALKQLITILQLIYHMLLIHLLNHNYALFSELCMPVTAIFVRKKDVAGKNMNVD